MTCKGESVGEPGFRTRRGYKTLDLMSESKLRSNVTPVSGENSSMEERHQPCRMNRVSTLHVYDLDFGERKGPIPQECRGDSSRGRRETRGKGVNRSENR